MRRTSGLSLALLGLFLCVPFTLDAASPSVVRVDVAGRETRAQVGRLQVAARFDSGAGDRLRIQLTAVNPTDKPQVAHVRVDVFERAPMSRMARMVPPPVERGHVELTVELAPGQRFAKTVPMVAPGPKGGPVLLAKTSRPRAYLGIRPAPAPRAGRTVASKAAAASARPVLARKPQRAQRVEVRNSSGKILTRVAAYHRAE